MMKSLVLVSVLVLACSWIPLGLCVEEDNTHDTATTVAPKSQTAIVLNQTDICSLPPERGLCLNYIPQFFYNSMSKRCEIFIYGGCAGNQNRFSSRRLCDESCHPKSVDTTQNDAVRVVPVRLAIGPKLDKACIQPPDSGPCLAYMPQYFYNATSGKCDTFVYGGCGGNLNRFDSLLMCQMKCQTYPTFNSTEVCNQPSDTGLCKAYMPQFFYNTESQRCEPFIYGGCLGNLNRFDSLKVCLQMCNPDGNDVIFPLVHLKGAAFKSAEICNLPPKTGPCKAYLERYYYNSTSQSCEKFIYGGCTGNENNFVSVRQCLLSCDQKDGVSTLKVADICSLPPDTGPCKAGIPRYFHNSTSSTCEEFRYGGCLGNRNNFIDKEDCRKTCKSD